MKWKVGNKGFVIIGILLFISVLSFSSNLTVGFIATNLSAEAQARVASSFETLAKEKGWEPIILNSQGFYETQANQLENLVQMKVDAIVLAMAHPLEIKPSLDKALDAGIPVITIDSGYVEGVVGDITADNFVIGAKMSTYLVDSLGGQGNIIAIKFEPHHGTRKRGKVLDVVLTEYPEINLLEEYTLTVGANFVENTRSAMETYVLRYGDKIDGVWCAFDQLAYAVSDVLQEYGLHDVIVVGADGNQETFRRIREGTITATVAQPFEDMAAKAISLIEDIVIKGIPVDQAAPSKIIYLDAPLIDYYSLPK